MRILLLTQIVPYPPDSGPKIKTFHVLRYLAERGHRVTLASFVRDSERPHLAHLQSYCQEIHAVPLRRSRAADARAYLHSLRSGLPFLVARDAQREMEDLMIGLASQPFDIVQADQLTMAQFALQLRRAAIARSNHSPALVFDAHNAVHAIVKRSQQTSAFFLRPALALEANRLERYEGQLIAQFDHTLTVSEVDKRDLLKAHDRNSGNNNHQAGSTASEDQESNISVLPIAVDCNAMQAVKSDAPSANIITVSTLYYPPNADGVRWFLREVLPRVRSRVPTATCTVIGPRPPKDLIQFGKQHAASVQVTGYVPDLSPYFERAALMVVPVRAASGMRVRILEALARGIPVVTTTIGVEGIEAVNEEHLMVADDPADFAAAVVRLLENPTLRAQLERNGRCLVQEKYDWQVVLPTLESIYQSLDSK